MYKEILNVIKIGGQVLDDPPQMENFMNQLSGIRGAFLLVHGGGNRATQICSRMGIETQMINGRRVTDAETLEVVVMVYAGLLNKQLTAGLQSRKFQAIGLCGADSNLIRAEKRNVAGIDYGFVGDVHADSVNRSQLKRMLEECWVPVFSPITHDGNGQLLNTNADTIASAIAIAMSTEYRVKLLYCFGKGGVLEDIQNEHSIIRELNLDSYKQLEQRGAIHTGMIPKLDNAFHAIQQGVSEVHIMHINQIKPFNENKHVGTRLVC
ncbi:MAG: acetylglutamate kinase [Bacteroidia bacterium]|jgi:acetylglutamate kinase